MSWIDYIAQYTRPAPLPVLAVAPKAQQTGRKAAIRLPDKYVYRDGQLIDIRMQWSHACYDFVSRDEDWILLRNMHGVIGRRREDVLFDDEMVVNYRVAILAA